VGYPYDAYWMKPGLDCGFDAAKTLDEVMAETFQTTIDFAAYGGVAKKGT
jgi:hypothetical protein